MRRISAIFVGAMGLGCGGPYSDVTGDDSGTTGGGTGGTTGEAWACRVPAGEAPDWADQIGCQADFDALASLPLDASIPGARSVKTVIDQLDMGRLYFQNSQRFLIHWEFAHAHLSGMGRPIVPDLGQFNMTEYYSPQRRFLLGALTYYEGPGVWTYLAAGGSATRPSTT